MSIKGISLKSTNMDKDSRILKYVITALALVGLALLFVGGKALFGRTRTSKVYDRAVENYNEGKKDFDIEILTEAREDFVTLGDHKESLDYIQRIDALTGQIQAYEDALALYDNGDRTGAMKAFHDLDGFRDSRFRADSIALEFYVDALHMVGENNLDEADNLLYQIPEWSDQYERAKKLRAKSDSIRAGNELDVEKEGKYCAAVEAMNSGNLVEAQKLFLEIEGYKDTINLLYEVGDGIYDSAVEANGGGRSTEALSLIEHIDTVDEWAGYSKALQLKSEINTPAPEPHTEEPTTEPPTEEPTTEQPDPSGEVVYLSELISCDSKGYNHSKLEITDNVYGDNGDNNAVHLNALMGAGWRRYHIGGEYKAIKGTVFIMNGARATVKEPVQLILKDTNLTQFYEVTIYSGMDSVDFNIPLPETAQDEIVIEFYGAYCSYEWVGGVGEIGFVK